MEYPKSYVDSCNAARNQLEVWFGFSATSGDSLPSPYLVLGIPEFPHTLVTCNTIQTAFRKRMLEFHPDRHKNGARNKESLALAVNLVTEAREFLKNQEGSSYRFSTSSSTSHAASTTEQPDKAEQPAKKEQYTAAQASASATPFDFSEIYQTDDIYDSTIHLHRDLLQKTLNSLQGFINSYRKETHRMKQACCWSIFGKRERRWERAMQVFQESCLILDNALQAAQNHIPWKTVSWSQVIKALVNIMDALQPLCIYLDQLNLNDDDYSAAASRYASRLSKCRFCLAWLGSWTSCGSDALLYAFKHDPSLYRQRLLATPHDNIARLIFPILS
jgi:hypothetical protein